VSQKSNVVLVTLQFALSIANFLLYLKFIVVFMMPLLTPMQSSNDVLLYALVITILISLMATVMSANMM
jgi:hypothetical protein